MARTWYHGTAVTFDAWVFPPPRAALKPELHPHTAVFLTTDLQLAQAAGRNLCCAQLRDDARIIDLHTASPESDALRLRLYATELGRHCVHTHDMASWWRAWHTGEAMRWAAAESDFSKQYLQLIPQARRAAAGSRSADDRRAWLTLQNLTRQWIELIAVHARELGFDALTGNEIDSHRRGGSIACEVAFALTERALTDPVWLVGPKSRLKTNGNRK